MVASALAVDIVRDPQPPLLAMLRLAALECRIAPRLDATTAQVARLAAIEEMVTLLARVLPSLMQRRPIILRPASAERSFDEDWLLALLTALRDQDGPSQRFLLTRRVRPEGAAVLRMLLGDIVARLDA